MLVPFPSFPYQSWFLLLSSPTPPPILPFTLQGFLFCNLQGEFPGLDIKWGPYWQSPSSNPASAILLVPNGNLQHFGKTRKEGKGNCIPTSGPFLPQLINFCITPVSFLFHPSFSVLQDVLPHQFLELSVSAFPIDLYYAVVRSSILAISIKFAGNIV